MTDTRTTNEQIVELIKKQTYDERMEFAELFRDYLADWRGDHPEGSPDRDDFALWFDSLAEAFIEGLVE